MEAVRRRYLVPVKRGGIVRQVNDPCPCKIISCSSVKYLVNIRCDDNTRLSVHPFELDYLVNDQWVSGAQLQKAHEARIEQVNQAINARNGTPEGLE